MLDEIFLTELSGCLQIDYVPLCWVPPDPKVPHIPYTFFPRPNASKKKKRKHKLLPTCVTIGTGVLEAFLFCSIVVDVSFGVAARRGGK